MMKNIIKYLAILFITVTITGCEEDDNFKQSEVSLTPIYSITEISGGNPFKINIYKQKSLIVEYTSEVNVVNYTSSQYSDTSDATNYQVSVNKVDVDVTTTYVVSADKVTGNGTLTVDGVTVYTIKLIEEEVYN